MKSAGVYNTFWSVLYISSAWLTVFLFFFIYLFIYLFFFFFMIAYAHSTIVWYPASWYLRFLTVVNKTSFFIFWEISLCFLSLQLIRHLAGRASYQAGPGSSVGCASASYSDDHGFDPRVRQHSVVEICHEIISCHSLLTSDSSRAGVSYCWKDMHLVLVNRLRSLPRNSVVAPPWFN